MLAGPEVLAQDNPGTGGNPNSRKLAAANLIHFGDLIDVDVVGNIEYDWRGTLNPEGFLDSLPYSVEPIYGLCRTEDEIAADISREYGKTLRRPQVVVRILDRSNRAAVVLTGAVRSPQRFGLKRPARLIELLALSGGITENASGSVVIFRPGNQNCASRGSNAAGLTSQPTPHRSSSSTFTIAIRDLLSGSEDANAEVLSGDMITVTEALPVFVIGAVNNPRQVASRPDLTISQAVAMAGGVSKEARRGQAIVYRREGANSRTIDVDLALLRAGKAEDVRLKPYDIIDVGQKGAARRQIASQTTVRRRTDSELFRMPLRIIE